MDGPGPEIQGGGSRGGPRRWTGTGPRPARHIPWPELFKHHQSVLTGHLKMMDMVRKHCVEGTGNYATAQACVDRTHEMLRSFKKTTASFIPPRDNIDRVPLGASSASMYPGYSPADHIYGEAAAEYGMIMAEARRKGIEVKTDSEGLEYIVGQSSLSDREQIEQIKKEREQKKAASDSANPTSEDGVEDSKGEPMEDVQETGDGADLFTIDSNPTPVDQLQDTSTAIRAKNKANDKAKRRVSFQDEQSTTDDVPKKKMVKTSENVAVPNTATSAGTNDDFEEAVEARLKQKEEKRKKKTTDGKKRKRESDSSQTLREEPRSAPEQATVPINEVLTQKPKKKKAKKIEDEDDAPVFESNAFEDQTEKKRKKKRPITESGDAGHTGEADTKRKKKKHTKETAD